MGSVAPITSGVSMPPGGVKVPRTPRARPVKALRLRDDTRDADGFSALDLINGLRGVGGALDRAAVNGDRQDVDLVPDLSVASKVLSRMLGDRVDE